MSYNNSARESLNACNSLLKHFLFNKDLYELFSPARPPLTHRINVVPTFTGHPVCSQSM